MHKLRLALGLIVASLGVLATSASAAEFMLPAVQDTTIFENTTAAQNMPDNGNGLKVLTTSGSRAASLVQFDLSNVVGNITSAHLSYFDQGDQGVAGTFKSVTYFIHPADVADPAELTFTNSVDDVAFSATGMHQENVTYDSLYGTDKAQPSGKWIETPLAFASSLSFDFAAELLLDQYNDGGSADAGVLEFLNSSVSSPGYVIVLNWRSSRRRFFGDIESGNPPLLVITTDAGVVGDYNEDGLVDLADYTVWRDNLGAPAGTLPNDSSGLKIGTEQYQIWKDNFGTGGGDLGMVSAQAVTVPEPTSWLMACSAIALFGFRQSRK